MTEQKLTYSLICPKRPECVVLLYYNLDGQLIGLEFNNDAGPKFKATLGKELPVTVDDLKRFTDVGCAVKDITNINLSFDQFWTVYAYKVGNMKRCKKLWGLLPDEEKIMALGFIRRLRANYLRKNLQFPYPETYLAQRRWENILD